MRRPFRKGLAKELPASLPASAIVGLAILTLDQMVKEYVTAHIPLGESRPFLPGFVELRALHNYGAAWSSFSGMRWLLTIATSAIVLWVLSLLLRGRVRHPVGVLACCLIIAGGLGNSFDRIRLGYVVDMFCFQFISFPIFTVADMCIDAGVALGVLYYYRWFDKDNAREANHGTDHPPA